VSVVIVVIIKGITGRWGVERWWAFVLCFWRMGFIGQFLGDFVIMGKDDVFLRKLA
jgi:hypothetical protein